MISLKGTNAIVTGAGAGMGLQMTRALLASGARVLAVDLAIGALQALEASSEGALASVECDLCAADAPMGIDKAAREHFGRPANALVNNAGLGRNAYAADYLRSAPRNWEIDDAVWQRFFAVNALGAIRLTNAVIPGMLEEGWGRIVAVTTSLDAMLRFGSGPYGASKAALEAYAASLGAELEATGVAVNVLLPGGPVDTSMVPETRGLDRATLLRPDVIVAPLRWLLSKESDGVTRRRFRANLWDPEVDAATASETAGAPIAWSSLAAGQMRPVQLTS